MENRLFKGLDTDIDLQALVSDSKEIAWMSLVHFPAVRDLSASTKRTLAAQEWKYVQNYADAKTTVTEEIMARAQSAKS